MAQTPKQAPKTQEFGFGKIDAKQKRLLNRDGTYNFKRVGLSWKERFNVYHYLINTSWHWFGVWVFVWYSVINLFFTAAYYMAGIDTLGGMVYTSGWYQFCEVYFFSAQTLTTVGYGRVNPLGLTASAVSTVEMLMGLLSFALVTGLLYGRFSKPSRQVLFSEKAVIAPFQGGMAFMFRIANRIETNLMNMEAKLNLSINEYDSVSEQQVRRFYPLTLERDRIIFFPANWTLVHPITEDSPLWGLTAQELAYASPEFMTLITGYDDTFERTMYEKASYAWEDIVWNAKFKKISSIGKDGVPIVDLAFLSEVEELN